MFDNLSTKLQKIFSKLKSYGKLSPKQVKAALREVRLALLEADVNFKVVKDFISRVEEKAVGREVLESLTPAQQVIKIVQDELTNLMGTSTSKLVFASTPPTILMLVGLQGSGKTSATVKLAYYLKNQGKNPLIVAADTYRPAATEQLETLASESGIKVFSKPKAPPDSIAEEGVKDASSKGYDVVIIDTSGRMHADEAMMEELKTVKKKTSPHQIILVVDAMTGQDAVNIATSFKDKVDFDGAILTKLDGDARGGAALSVRAVTGKPIKFVTLGEKVDTLETFHPQRMASRILGFGDMLTLIEKAQDITDEKEVQELKQKIKKEEFTLEDFLEQIKQVKKMGSFEDILNMLPGLPSMLKSGKAPNMSEKDVTRICAIIDSMTPWERQNPSEIDGSRRLRIAKGSGANTQEVNHLLKQFNQTKKLMKQAMEGRLKIKPGKKAFPFI